jgi:hypothetical protein
MGISHQAIGFIPTSYADRDHAHPLECGHPFPANRDTLIGSG